MPVPSDLAIARAARPRPIVEIAAGLGIPREALRLYGDQVAKVLPGTLGPPREPRSRPATSWSPR